MSKGFFFGRDWGTRKLTAYYYVVRKRRSSIGEGKGPAQKEPIITIAHSMTPKEIANVQVWMDKCER